MVYRLLDDGSPRRCRQGSYVGIEKSVLVRDLGREDRHEGDKDGRRVVREEGRD